MRPTCISTGLYPRDSIRITWPLFRLASLISTGVAACGLPLTPTVESAKEEVTGIGCVLVLNSVPQFGNSRMLMRVRKRKKRFAPVILIVDFPYALLFWE